MYTIQSYRKECNKHGYVIKALEVMYAQTVAPCDIARTLKSISAIELFKVYPQLKQFYARCGGLLSDEYFVSTVGHIGETTVKKYIEEQKNAD